MKKQVPHDFDINKYEMIAQVIENRMTDTLGQKKNPPNPLHPRLKNGYTF